MLNPDWSIQISGAPAVCKVLFMLKIETSSRKKKFHAILHLPGLSFAVYIGDHLRFGVICGPIWGLFLVWGSFAALYISQRLCNRVLAILRTYVAFAASYLHIYVLYLSGYLAAIVTLNAK